MIWVINANSATCPIYQYDTSLELALIKNLNHAENRMRRQDYMEGEKPGKFKTDAGGQGAYMPHADPKEVELNVFAHEIAAELNKGRNAHQYEKLIFIMPPHILGLVKNHLDKHVQSLIQKTIIKDVIHYNEKKLIELIEKDSN